MEAKKRKIKSFIYSYEHVVASGSDVYHDKAG
jgi:hypothetical protein